MARGRRLTFDGRVRSVKFALRGVRAMMGSQHNAWIHAAATVTVVATGLIVGLSASSWACIVLATGSVWTAEALNTACEFLTDVASPDFHPLAEKAKDVAAGAVLLAAIEAVIVGGLVFWPAIVRLLR